MECDDDQKISKVCIVGVHGMSLDVSEGAEVHV